MKRRVKRLAAASIIPIATCVALGLNACALDDSSLYLNPAAPGLIALEAGTPTPPRFTVIWSDDVATFALSPSARDLLSEARHSRLGSGLVAMRFPISPNPARAKALVDRFRRDPRTLSVITKGQGRALVRFSSPNELADLARAARRLNKTPGTTIEIVRPDARSGSGQPPTATYREDARLATVDDLLSVPTKSSISASIQTLQDLGTRYHSESQGIATTAAVRQMLEAAGSGLAGLSFTQITHDASPQKSLIARLAGQSSTLANEVVVLSAHLDSTNHSDSTDAPGADDNASGVATLVEILRSIAARGATFDRTIEFHAYAAEELGLVGSGDVVSQYRAQGTIVRAVMNFDMTAYQRDPRDPTIYLLSTDTTADARRSAKDLLTTYQGGGFKELPLPAGTSDHRSWFEAGYHAVFPFEHPTDHNPYYHTINDTLAHCTGLNLALRITRLGLTFAAHQAGITTPSTEYATALAAIDHTDDLKVALLPGSGDNRWVLAIAAPPLIKGVEFCRIDAATDTGCALPRVVMESVGAGESRQFFLAPSPAAWPTVARVRLFGYDAKDAPVAIRNVRVERLNATGR